MPKLSLAVSLLCALTFALALAIPKGYALGILSLFLLSLVFLYKAKTSLSRFSKEDALLALSFLAYFLLTGVWDVARGSEMSALDNPSRFLFAVSVLMLMQLVIVKRSFLLWGCALGAVGAFGMAAYEHFYLGIGRVGGGHNPIMFGNIAMLLAALTLFGAVATYFSGARQWLVITLVVAALLGIGAAVLSGTRGSWLMLPVIAAGLLFSIGFKRANKRLVLQVGVVCLAVFAVIGVASKDRFARLASDFQAYQEGSLQSSSGHRIELWRSAIIMFEAEPVFGVGEINYKEMQLQNIEQKRVIPGISDYGHAHNEFLDIAAKRGLIGVVALLLLYAVPLWLFAKRIFNPVLSPDVRSWALVGATIPLSYIVFGLTQSMFGHSSGVLMYAFPVVFMWAAVKSLEQEPTSHA